MGVLPVVPFTDVVSCISHSEQAFRTISSCMFWHCFFRSFTFIVGGNPQKTACMAEKQVPPRSCLNSSSAAPFEVAPGQIGELARLYNLN